MSVVAYAALTTKREEANPGTSTSTAAPGVKTYVDAFAALVPAEVLTLHGLIISVTTTTKDQTTQINTDNVGTLAGAFWGLVVLSIVLYVVPRVKDGKWDRLDYLRMVIPALAFVGWTMLQRTTAFDAVAPAMQAATRTVVALFGGVLLGLAAAVLAYKADQKAPPAP
jgi:hypothetical protein